MNTIEKAKAEVEKRKAMVFLTTQEPFQMLEQIRALYREFNRKTVVYAKVWNGRKYKKIEVVCD